MRMRCVSVAVILAGAAGVFGQSVPTGGPVATPAAPVAEATGSSTQSAPAVVDATLVDLPTRRVVRLTNGFTIILQQNRTAPAVAVRIYIRAGALTEQQHMGQGISHVVEHLVAGASSGKRKESENTLLLEQIGNDSNAYTQADSTVYFITTSADKWPTALDLLVDFTTNTDFTQEEFAREYKVVQREIEMDEAEADRIFYQHMQETRYLASPVRHPVIGYKPAFQKITYEDVKAYYQKMYVPDNMIISVAGDIDLEAAQKLIIGQVKDIKRKAVPSIALPAEPEVTSPRLSVSTADVKEARINWAFPSVNLYSPDLYAMDVLASVLGGSDSSLMVKALQDKGLVAGISASDPTPWYADGELDITAVLAPEKIPDAQKAVFDVLEEVLKNGVSAEDVQRAKARAASERVFNDQTAEQQATNNALDFMSTGDIDFSKHYVERIEKVTPEQVKAMALKYLNRQKLMTTMLLPANAKNPFAVAEPAKVASMDTVAVKKTVLKNGVTLLISRNPAAPIACFNLFTAGGLLAENDQTNGTGATMMTLMTRSTETRTHEQVAQFLDGTGTSLVGNSGNNSFQLSMACMKENATAAFALFADVALHPRFEQAQLNQIREPRLSAVTTAIEDWTGEGESAIRQAYYADSPYMRLPQGKVEVIKNLTPELIRAHYQNYFLDPQKMVITISGDIDPVAALAWAMPFEAIPQHTPKLATTTIAAPARTVNGHTEKDSAIVLMAYPPGMEIASPDRYAMTLLQTYLGGYSSPSGSVLHETLRGKGLVYIVQAQNISGTAGGMFLITALGEPANAKAIVANIKEIVDSVKNGDITEAHIASAKDQAITGEMLSKLTIADKSSSEGLFELLGLGYDESVKFPQKIREVTREQVVAAAKKYLTEPVVVILTPEGK